MNTAPASPSRRSGPARAWLRRSLAALCFTLVAGPLAAQVVNFNFMEDYNSTNPNFGLGAASDNALNTYWNRVGPNDGDFPQNRGTMFSSDGTTQTTIRISFTSPDFGTGDTPLFAESLFQGYAYTGTGGTAFTISGLTAGQSYDFYFLSETGDLSGNRAATYTLDGTSYSLTAAATTSFTEGVNYVKFSLTPSGTTLLGSFAAAPLSDGEANFSGLQIVTASAVPEPSTYAAIFGALAGIVAVHTKRGKTRCFPAGSLS